MGNDTEEDVFIETLTGSFYLQSLMFPLYEEENEYGITARIGEDVMDLGIQ